jgi:hypothetical protein
MEYDALSFKIGIIIAALSRTEEPAKESEPAEEEEV